MLPGLISTKKDLKRFPIPDEYIFKFQQRHFTNNNYKVKI